MDIKVRLEEVQQKRQELVSQAQALQLQQQQLERQRQKMVMELLRLDGELRALKSLSEGDAGETRA